MRLSLTSRSIWQPVAQWGHVVLTFLTSQLRYFLWSLADRAPVGQWETQFPQDSQVVSDQGLP